jgi:phage replication-related protein YjqB (UPF0714/DUF867 family)
MSADLYNNYSELAEAQTEGVDYQIRLHLRSQSDTAVIVPHGGSIERRTTEIGEAVAGNEFNFYAFEGLHEEGTYDILHITSHRFDEPQCLTMVQNSLRVVTIHGYGGDEEQLLLGGRDTKLVQLLAHACRQTGVPTLTENHQYPGIRPNNICNRGLTGMGVQIEFSDALRGGVSEGRVINAIRDVLLTY